jgi:CDP-6-deoxy-D-xylo-4-hexulose-3-dehydrase
MQPAYRHLDKAENYPNANVVLDRVFFIGAAPHYHEKIFEYIQERLKARLESQKLEKVLNPSC